MVVQSRGKAAEIAAAKKYGFKRESTSWYDGKHPNTGTKYEVKSGIESVRFWEDQHRSLTASNNNASAFYIIVQMDKRGNIHRMKRRDIPTITAIIEQYGGWVLSGHHRTDGREKYVPIEALF